VGGASPPRQVAASNAYAPGHHGAAGRDLLVTHFTRIPFPAVCTPNRPCKANPNWTDCEILAQAAAEAAGGGGGSDDGPPSAEAIASMAIAVLYEGLEDGSISLGAEFAF
jgi:hypothetical protein